MKEMTLQDINRFIDDINNTLSYLDGFTRDREMAIIVAKLQKTRLWLYHKTSILKRTAYQVEVDQ